MLAGQEDSFQIDFHLAIPVLFGQGYRTALGRTTNVVHQDVDTPKPLYAGGDHPGQGIVVGDIAGGGRDLGSRFLGSSNGFRHRILSHIHAKVRAYAARTGDDRNLAVKPPSHGIFLCPSEKVQVPHPWGGRWRTSSASLVPQCKSPAVQPARPRSAAQEQRWHGRESAARSCGCPAVL